jgi:hypothetical protein
MDVRKPGQKHLAQIMIMACKKCPLVYYTSLKLHLDGSNWQLWAYDWQYVRAVPHLSAVHVARAL